VLNHLTGRPLDYGIKDYDLAYFDASDLSYEVEDAVIRRVKAAFNEPLPSMVEVRDQALWSSLRISLTAARLSRRGWISRSRPSACKEQAGGAQKVRRVGRR
jgi:hypothetical protein